MNDKSGWETRKSICFALLNEYLLYSHYITKLIHKDVNTVFACSHFESGHEKKCLTPHANIKGADQPAHPRSVISIFVIRFPEIIIHTLANSKCQDSSLINSTAERIG